MKPNAEETGFSRGLIWCVRCEVSWARHGWVVVPQPCWCCGQDDAVWAYRIGQGWTQVSRAPIAAGT